MLSAHREIIITIDRKFMINVVVSHVIKKKPVSKKVLKMKIVLEKTVVRRRRAASYHLAYLTLK